MSEVLTKSIGGFVLILILIFGVSLLLALPVMLLWNWLMPEIFGLTTITFWQALGIMLLSGFLFSSKSGGSSSA